MNEKDQDLALCEAQHTIDMLESKLNALEAKLEAEQATNRQVQALMLDYVVRVRAGTL